MSGHPATLPDGIASPAVAIACGGTGGHLFPGLAVGRELRRRGATVTLMVSSKEIDRQAAASAGDMEIVTLPAVGLAGSNLFGFMRGFWNSYRIAWRHFKKQRPQFVLGMGGFTAAPPVLAGRRAGAKTFLHEANSIPGRANRWLARITDGAFVYFPQAVKALGAGELSVTGMPVRDELLRLCPQAEARRMLGLNAEQPVLLVMGGSQGAHRLNEIVTASLPQLAQAHPHLQFVHLTGMEDLKRVKAAYESARRRAMVEPFLTAMELALSAADAAVSRAGASSLAEFAACGLPALLVPYPTAADNHQFFNARAFADGGAARLVQQQELSSERLLVEIQMLLEQGARRSAMRTALRAWHYPDAAANIAAQMLRGAVGFEVKPAARAGSSTKLGVLNV